MEPNYCTTTAFFGKQLPCFMLFLYETLSISNTTVEAYHLAKGNGGAIVICVMSGSFLLLLYLCEYFQ